MTEKTGLIKGYNLDMEFMNYNCIVVFDKEKEKILFCKREKDPYKGLYNFIGGKLEPNESSDGAAYRELSEETGIGRNNIQLFRLMDITYYQQKIVLEIFAGVLHEDVELIEEVNPLEWISIYEDFADPKRYAGDKNIAHIVETALKYDFCKKENVVKQLKREALCIGIDGCRGGWIAAVIDQGELRIEKYVNIQELISKYPLFDDMLIDMVIGLPSDQEQYERRPDCTARRLIVPRTSTIFAVPSRQAVYEDTEERQIDANKMALGKGLAKQTMAIIPKMRELDGFLAENKNYKNVIRESHPEVCFARLNGTVVMTKKSEMEGLMERVHILSGYLPGLSVELIISRAKELCCNADDIVDAVCLAVTANLSIQGRSEVIPGNVMMDDHGLRMQMVIPEMRDISEENRWNAK